MTIRCASWLSVKRPAALSGKFLRLTVPVNCSRCYVATALVPSPFGTANSEARNGPADPSMKDIIWLLRRAGCSGNRDKTEPAVRNGNLVIHTGRLMPELFWKLYVLTGKKLDALCLMGHSYVCNQRNAA